MVPAGFEHEYIGVKLIVALENFVSRKKLGAVFGSGMGYWMKSENRGSPDVSFINRERLHKFNRMPKGFFKGSPDLAVEILSTSDTVERVHGKIVEYFENDTKLVWDGQSGRTNCCGVTFCIPAQAPHEQRHPGGSYGGFLCSCGIVVEWPF